MADPAKRMADGVNEFAIDPSKVFSALEEFVSEILRRRIFDGEALTEDLETRRRCLPLSLFVNLRDLRVPCIASNADLFPANIRVAM